MLRRSGCCPDKSWRRGIQTSSSARGIRHSSSRPAYVDVSSCRSSGHEPPRFHRSSTRSKRALGRPGASRIDAGADGLMLRASSRQALSTSRSPDLDQFDMTRHGAVAQAADGACPWQGPGRTFSMSTRNGKRCTLSHASGVQLTALGASAGLESAEICQSPAGSE